MPDKYTIIGGVRWSGAFAKLALDRVAGGEAAVNTTRRSFLVSAAGVAATAVTVTGARASRASSYPVMPGPGAQVLPVGASLGSGYQGLFASVLSGAEQQAEIQRMKNAGITWIRMDAQWSWVQQSATSGFDWAIPDATADIMLAAGMNLVILLTGRPPSGAALAPGTAPVGSPWPTPDPQLYAAYCAAAAAHYGAKGVTTFELWNEPNLDNGYAPPPKTGTPAGWGYLSPKGFAGLATAAYPAIKAACPGATVLGGTLATRSDFGNGSPRNVSWPAVSAGTATVTVSCPAASPGDTGMFFSDVNTPRFFPDGTVIISVDSVSKTYTLGPPYWSSSFPAIPAATSVTARVAYGYPPSVFLTRAYAEAGGKPMWDALAIHPYTGSYLPSTQPVTAGGWTAVPALRDIMVANGEGGKSMWITEMGAGTGLCAGSWPSASATDTSLTVTSPNATSDDVHYYWSTAPLPGDNLLPEGSYVSAATAGTGWTVKPPTGLTLAEPVSAGQQVGSLTIAAKGTVTIQDGAVIKVAVAPTNPGQATQVLKTTALQTVTITPGGQETVQVAAVTSQFDYPASSPIQADAGQAWGGNGIPARSNAAVYVYPPGVVQNGAVSEATQAKIVTEACKVWSGVPLSDGTTAPGWGWVDALFIYCWSDAGAAYGGPFGLTRADGTAKPALPALAAATPILKASAVISLSAH